RCRRSAGTTGLKPIVAITSGVLALGIAGCGQPATTPAPVTSPDAGQAGPAVAPPVPQPIADRPCSYLPVTAVQDVNGERVGGVQVSADQPYPACFFLTKSGSVQLRTWIVVATPGVARATIDAVAPVATSDLAQLPGGWSGGSQPTKDGAVYAVARQGTAVVITTNQRQTISAREIAKRVIAALERK
ncbi:MAG: DUF2020 domain-containing protein, partial [Pseudonocardiaceae bacterium]